MNDQSELPRRAVANAPTDGIPYSFLPAPIVEARGALVRTAEGRDYVDLGNVYGAVMLGHGNERVTTAVESVLRSGIVSCGGHRLADEVAEMLLAAIPGEGSRQVCFHKTGTAALRSVADGCRRATGRDLIATCGYHGWDSLWALPLGPGLLNESDVFDCFFIPALLERFLHEHAGRTAAFIISPDYIHLPRSRLEELHRIATRAGVAIVVDDVKWGYRVGTGSSFQHLGMKFDACVVSKSISNGWPVAAIIGSQDILAYTKGHVSTLTFEASTLAATRACLSMLTDGDVYRSIAQEGGRFVDGARSIFRGLVPIAVVGDGHMFQFVCASDSLEDAFHRLCVHEGLLVFGGDNQAPSWAFRDEVVDLALERIARVAHEVARLGPWPGALSEDRFTLAAWQQMEGYTGPTGTTGIPEAFVAARLREQA